MRAVRWLAAGQVAGLVAKAAEAAMVLVAAARVAAAVAVVAAVVGMVMVAREAEVMGAVAAAMAMGSQRGAETAVMAVESTAHSHCRR